jgi:uncharacterized repeat protein (TIGR01451 family)
MTKRATTSAGAARASLSKWLHVLLPMAVLPVFAVPGLAQGPFFPPGPQHPAHTAPLLYVRMAGPAGMTVTFFRGGVKGQTLTAPFTVGLRPGYVYRVQIDGIARFPERSFYPSLEVRGSLSAAPGARPADFPVTLTFSEADFRAAAEEAMVTKAVVLERPELALPVASRPQQPLEVPVPPGRDPVAEAGRHGRVLLVLRLGAREVSVQDLAAWGLPGTILLPGEAGLAMPPVPPALSWQCISLLYDPLLGPEPPAAEVCIPDGGDSGTPAGFDVEGRLRGLDPTDTVAEYQDSHGWRRIAVSNRVCLCVPRFLVYRQETQPARQVASLAPGGMRVLKGGNLLQTEQAALLERQQQHAGAVLTPQRISGALSFTGPAVFGQMAGLNVIGTLRSPGNVNATCLGPLEVPQERPLLLDKWPDKCTALIGDVVTFTLRYRNQGGRPITEVAVSDSLAARYEFIPGSNRSDRPSTFTTRPNEVGSLILRWQINDPLPPGETGTVTFQVRVR